MTTPTDNTDGALDAAILLPDRTTTIAGKAVVMREYSFAESLRHFALIAALSDAMTGIALNRDFHDFDSLRAAFGANADGVMELIAIACDEPVAWVRGLNADDGEALHMLWWGVNADFFLRRVLLSVKLRKVRELAGLTSSPPSLPPDTTREASPDTRSGS